MWTYFTLFNCYRVKHFIVMSDMNALFNQKVTDAQPVQRPGGGSSGGLYDHSGTKVTLQDGSEHLIHHGSNEGGSIGSGSSSASSGGSNPTVITPAEGMSPAWKSVGDSYHPDSNVGGMMGQGESYSMTNHNCHDVTAGQPNSTVETTKLFGTDISTGITPKHE